MEKITKTTLIENDAKVTKRFVLLDSTQYDEEAFEYALSLVTAAGSIAFISDRNLIWAQGQYFGGNVMDDSLFYWSTIRCMSENSNEIQELLPSGRDAALEIRTDRFINVSTSSDSEANTNIIDLSIKTYDIVNQEPMTLDSNATYRLGTDADGRIALIKYIEPTLTYSTFMPIEFDSGDTLITFTIRIDGTDVLTVFEIAATSSSAYVNTSNVIQTVNRIDERTMVITAMIPNNTQIAFAVHYGDAKIEKTDYMMQNWGYGVYYGHALLADDYIFSKDSLHDISILQNKYVMHTPYAVTITIRQAPNEYAVFACPADWHPSFTDTSIGMQGGWHIRESIYVYSTLTKYYIWETDQRGLGDITWMIAF